jgi:hypothetical protein
MKYSFCVKLRKEFGGTNYIALPLPPPKRNILDMEPNDVFFERYFVYPVIYHSFVLKER